MRSNTLNGGHQLVWRAAQGVELTLVVCSAPCRSVNISQDEDFTVGHAAVASFSRKRDLPAVAQTPLVSRSDRELLDLPPPPPPEKDSDSSRSTGTKLPQKPQPRRTSSAGAYKRGSLDWSRSDRSGSTFLPFGFFSSLTGGGDGKGRYEAVAPMASKKSGDKTYVELNMDDYAEGLRLTAGGDDDEDYSKMRRQSSGVGQFVRRILRDLCTRR